MKNIKKKYAVNYSDLSARQSVVFYTLAFGVLSVFLFIFFIVQDKSFIWYSDGLPQHYPALRYIGVWGRELISNVFSGNFSVRNFDFSIGYGADIFTTFHYYGLTDPLNWLSVFVPESYTHYLYSFLIVLRLYISGIGFIFYCRKMKQTDIFSVVSSFIYVFSAYGLHAGIRHPFFLTPMVYLPLILIGCEKILENKNPLLFIASVSLCVISNFYFSYMAIIMIVIYVFIRCFAGEKEKLAKSVIRIGKFLGFGILALMISAFIFLPVVIVFLGNNRSAIEKSIPLLYDWEYYQSLISSFMGYKNGGYWNLLGYTPLGLVSLFYIFAKKREYKQLKTAAAISLVLQIFPIMGSVLNGFDYVSNRFVWANAFLIAFISACTFKEIISSPKKDKLKLLAISAVYLAAFILLKDGRNFSATINVVLLFFMLSVLIVSEKLFEKNARKICISAVAIVAAVSIGYNGFFLYSPKYGDYISEFVPDSVSFDAIEVSESSGFNDRLKNTENSFCRYEVSANSLTRLNQSLFNDTAGISYYFSLSDTYVVPGFYDVELPLFSPAVYYSVNQQTFLSTLASVKYLVSHNARGIPAGYSPVGSKECYFPYEGVNKELSLYENKNALPIGYTYDGYITRDNFAQLSPVEKQEAMMQGVLLENSLSGFEMSAVEVTSESLPYTIELPSNVTATDEGIFVESGKAAVKICFEGRADSETYIRINNFNVNPPENKFLGIDKEQPVSLFTVSVKSALSSRTIYLRTSYDPSYAALHNFTVNLGYSAEPLKECTIILPEKGFYSWDDIEIISQPMYNYDKYVDALKEDIFENLEMKDDRISGTVELEKSKILCLSVPYSKGWSAYVDGEEVELLRANGWCMAIPLEEGEHNITLRYATPGLKAGVIISVLGLVISVAVVVYYIRKSKKERTV